MLNGLDFFDTFRTFDPVCSQWICYLFYLQMSVLTIQTHNYVCNTENIHLQIVLLRYA